MNRSLSSSEMSSDSSVRERASENLNKFYRLLDCFLIASPSCRHLGGEKSNFFPSILRFQKKEQDFSAKTRVFFQLIECKFPTPTQRFRVTTKRLTIGKHGVLHSGGEHHINLLGLVWSFFLLVPTPTL